MRTPGPSRKMCFLRSLPLIACGTGSVRSSDFVAGLAQPPGDLLEHPRRNDRLGRRQVARDRRNRDARIAAEESAHDQRDRIRIHRQDQRIGRRSRRHARSGHAHRLRVLHPPCATARRSPVSTVRSSDRFCFSPSLIAGADLLDEASRGVRHAIGLAGLADEPLDDVGAHFRGAGGTGHGQHSPTVRRPSFRPRRRRCSSCSARPRRSTGVRRRRSSCGRTRSPPAAASRSCRRAASA